MCVCLSGLSRALNLHLSGLDLQAALSALYQLFISSLSALYISSLRTLSFELGSRKVCLVFQVPFYVNAFLIQGLYDKTPLEQQYSPSVSEIVARLLTTDPEMRPSAKEILESLTVQEEPVNPSITGLGAAAKRALDSRNGSSPRLPPFEWSAERPAMLDILKVKETQEVFTDNSLKETGSPHYKQMDTERKDGTE